MIYYPIDEVKPGMILGKSIISEKGDLLLARGEVLTQMYIEKIKKLGYPGLYIIDDDTKGITPQETLSEITMLQTNKVLRESVENLKKMVETQKDTVKNLKQMLKSKDFKNIIIPSKIKNVVSGIIENVLTDTSNLINLSLIRGLNNYFYQHAIDVTVISVHLGVRFQFNKYELEELAIGALLHNIGMVVIPNEIINKKGKLTFEEFSLIKEHPIYGFEILKSNSDISLLSAHVAYQHHERQDGSGYPRGLKGRNEYPYRKDFDPNIIHRYAEIVTVADTYVAMISPRPYSKPKTPEEALKIIIKVAGSHLNKVIVEEFLKTIPVYPVGSLIYIKEANDKTLLGYKGAVVEVDENKPERPLIVLFKSKNNDRIDPPIYLDLKEHLDVKIGILL